MKVTPSLTYILFNRKGAKQMEDDIWDPFEDVEESEIFEDG